MPPVDARFSAIEFETRSRWIGRRLHIAIERKQRRHTMIISEYKSAKLEGSAEHAMSDAQVRRLEQAIANLHLPIAPPSIIG